MKEIFINIDETTSEGIFTRQDNNNAEVYKIYIISNKGKVNLNGKSVKMGYNFSGTNSGDILVLNITDGENGEITLPITNKLTRKDGVFHCQLAIYGEDGYLENSSKFTLTVEKNVFSKITEGIEDIKGLTYIENLLEEARKIGENLKVSITTGNTLNDSLEENIFDGVSLKNTLENNINNARDINVTLNTTLEQTDVAITKATQKKEELENSINEADTIDRQLKATVETAKQTNREATFKNAELKETLRETLEVINNLDESQDIPGLNKKITELQNGLKSNQSLEYEGSFMECENTIENRTEEMVILGKTYKNEMPSLNPENFTFDGKTNLEGDIFTTYLGANVFYDSMIKCKLGKTNLKPNTKYSMIVDILENDTNEFLAMFTASNFFYPNNSSNQFENKIGRSIVVGTTPSKRENWGDEFTFCIYRNSGDSNKKIKFKAMILEGDWRNKDIPEYFEGVKSFGEAEQEGDKYKITTLSHSFNFWNIDNIKLEDKLKINIDGDNKNFIATSNSVNSFYVKLHAKAKETYVFSGTLKSGKPLYYRITTTDFRTLSGGVFGNPGEFSISYTPTEDIEILARIVLPSSAKPCEFQNFYFGLLKEKGQPYIEDRKEILISAPLRSINNVQDIMYEDNGKVKIDRYIGQREYQEGDESNRNVITDKINTVYILDKPTTEIVANCVDIDLDTFQERTYFYILNSLPGTLDFRVPSNLGTMIQNMSKEINNIWDVIDMLVAGLLDTKKDLALKTIKNNLNKN